jgi:hypothetical protein
VGQHPKGSTLIQQGPGDDSSIGRRGACYEHGLSLAAFAMQTSILNTNWLLNQT